MPTVGPMATIVQAYELPGLSELSRNVALNYLKQELPGKAKDWLKEAYATVLQGGGPMSARDSAAILARLKDPAVQKQALSILKDRMVTELPKITRAILTDHIYKINCQQNCAQSTAMVTAMSGRITVALTKNAEQWVGKIYEAGIGQLEPYLKHDLRVGAGTVKLDATDIRGTLDQVLNMNTVGNLIGMPLADAFGQEVYADVKRRFQDVLQGQLPPEAIAALNKGPDEFSRYAAQAKEYLPGAQLSALKDKVLNLPVLTIPNEIYIGILAANAAKHLAAGLAGCPLECNPYEITRAAQVTQVMIWQGNTKQELSINIQQLMDMASQMLGAAGGLGNLGAVGRGLQDVTEQWQAVGKAAGEIDQFIGGKLDRVTTELQAAAKELQTELLKLQNQLAAPLQEWVQGTTQGMTELSQQIKDKLPPNFNGVPGTWDEFKTLVKPDPNLPDATTAPLPSAEISPAEEIPAQNPDDSSEYDPVYLHNGEFVHLVVDVTIPGRGLDFQFARVYRSRSDFAGRLGWNWTHNWEEALRTWQSPQGPGVTWIRADGQKYFFTQQAGDPRRFVAPAGIYAELRIETTAAGKSFALQEADGRTTRFDHQGLLSAKCDRYNNCLQALRDRSGQLHTVRDTVGRDIRFNYDGRGRLHRMQDWSGRRWQYDYDAAGDLTAVTSPATSDFPHGLVTRYRYSAGSDTAALNHNLLLIMDPRGGVYLRNSYGATGFAADRIVAQQYGDPQYTVQSQYRLICPPWLLKHHPDRVNVVTALVLLKNRRGVTRLHSLNMTGQLLAEDILDAAGTRHVGLRYRYTGDGERVATILPSGRQLERDQFTENQFGQRSSVTDANGMVTQYRYQDANLVEVVRDARGQKLSTRYEYDAVGNIIAVTAPNGGATRYEVDAQNLIRRETTPLGYQRDYTYDAHGNLTAAAFKHADRVLQYQWGYDVLDRLIWARAPIAAGQVAETQYRYDADGRVVEQIAPEGNRVVYAYNAWGLLTEVVRGAGTKTASRERYHYDADWQLVAIEDAENNRTQVQHTDNLPEPRAVASPAEQMQLHRSYDLQGRMTRAQLPTGLHVQFQYDDRDNLLQEIPSEGLPLRYDYDDMGRRIAVTQGARTTRFVWDRNGRLRDVIDPLGGHTQRDYDALDRLITQTSADGARRSWAYSPRDLVVSECLPNRHCIQTKYNELGLPRQRQANQLHQEFSYDARGRLIQAVQKAGAETAVTQYGYNELSQVIAARSSGHVVQQEFNLPQRQRQLRFSDGQSLDYRWDPLQRLETIHSAQTIISKWQYSANNAQIQQQWGAQTTRTLQLTAWGDVAHDSLGQSYQYNVWGNVTAENYRYDSWQQLLQAGNQQWDYDLAGRRIATTAYRYDANGNRQQDERFTYRYDDLGRLTDVATHDGKKIAHYDYDAMDRRVSRTVWNAQGQVQRYDYVYLGWEPLEEWRDGQLWLRYVPGAQLDQPVAYWRYDKGQATLYNLIADRQGNVQELRNARGDILERYHYSPYGEVDVTASSYDNHRLYTGAMYDSETGLYYLRNRYYDPRAGEFLTPDPLGDKADLYASGAQLQGLPLSFHRGLGAAGRASMPNQLNAGGSPTILIAAAYHAQRVQNGMGVETNPYEYVRNNPLNGTDPLGLYVMRLNRHLNLMHLFNQGGEQMGAWAVRTNGDPKISKRTEVYGDTPTGYYKVNHNMVGAGPGFRHYGRTKEGKVIPPSAYGLGYIGLTPIVLEGQAENKRSGLAIHGGGRGDAVKNPFLNGQQGWVHTQGCVRMQNNDVIALVDQIRQLNVQGDTDGTLLVYDGSLTAAKDRFNDRVRTDPKYWPPNMGGVQ